MDDINDAFGGVFDTELDDSHGNRLEVHGANDLLKELEATVPVDRKDRSKIVEPGANYAQNDLWQNAPEIDHPDNIPSRKYLGSWYRKPQHIHDPGSVTHKPNQYMDGSTDVGFTPGAAPIARWVDLGTYRQDAQPFIDHTFQNMDYDTLFSLEAKAYSDLVQSKVEQGK